MHKQVKSICPHNRHTKIRTQGLNYRISKNAKASGHLRLASA